MVTGWNCKPIAVPPGPMPVPFNVSVTLPGATASKTIAASRPVPDAPVASALRVIVMSTRPPVDCWMKLALAPADRMKLPSCTLRTRRSAGSYVNVSVIVDSRVAATIDSGTVYGPCPTRNVVPGGEISTCAVPRPVDVVGGSGAAAGADADCCGGGPGTGVGAGGAWGGA